jgi:hypothetical protein
MTFCHATAVARPSSRNHRLRAAEQFHIEPAAGEQHVVESFVDIGSDEK